MAMVSSWNAASRLPGRKEAANTLGQPVPFRARYVAVPSVHAPSLAMSGVQQSARPPETETSAPPTASRSPASKMTAVTVAVRLPSSSAAAADSGVLLNATFSKLRAPSADQEIHRVSVTSKSPPQVLEKARKR